eukprot:4756629-Pyramimonas_sp.AAC.1
MSSRTCDPVRRGCRPPDGGSVPGRCAALTTMYSTPNSGSTAMDSTSCLRLCGYTTRNVATSRTSVGFHCCVNHHSTLLRQPPQQPRCDAVASLCCLSTGSSDKLRD